MIGLTGFGISSVLCALAPSVGTLIAARALQGAAASMLSPVALAIVVAAMADPRERAQAIGIWASVFGLSMAAGPTLGGALLAAFSWRSVFWVNAPLVLTAIAAVLLVVPESHGSRTRKLDVPGQVLLMIVLLLMVAGLIEAPHVGWGSPSMIAVYVTVAVALPVSILAETREDTPLIDLVAFRHPAFAAAVVGAFVVFVAISMTLLMNTFYLQQALGWTPLKTGLAVLPIAVGATAFAPVSGVLVGRIGPLPPLLLAGSFVATGGLLAKVATQSPGTDGSSTWLVLLAYVLFGTGVGFANAPLTNAAVAGLPTERAGVAGGITSTARQVGAATGIAVAGGLLSTQAGPQVSATLPGFVDALQLGWAIVAACGAVLLCVAAVTWRAGTTTAE